VFGKASELRCFDEAAPCTLEQESMNVIDNNPQDKYVPWLICMDSSKDKLSSCDSKTGVAKPASEAPSATLGKYLEADASINSTPTVHINGQKVKTSYSAIRKALCSADPSLSGCSAPLPNGADQEVQRFCTKPSDVVV